MKLALYCVHWQGLVLAVMNLVPGNWLLLLLVHFFILVSYWNLIDGWLS